MQMKTMEQEMDRESEGANSPPPYGDCWAVTDMSHPPKLVVPNSPISCINMGDVWPEHHNQQPQQEVIYLRQNSLNLDIETHNRRPLKTFKKNSKKSKASLFLTFIFKMATIGFISFIVTLSFYAIYGIQATRMRLSPGDYRLIIGDLERAHCKPCDELMMLLTAEYGSQEIALDDLEQKFGERDDNDNLLCCVKSPQQIIALINTRLGQMSFGGENSGERHQPPQKVALHAVLEASPAVPVRDIKNFSDISVSEWKFSSDLAFCDPGNPQTNLCRRFNPRHNNNGILIPFQGAYTINCRVAWKAPMDGPSDSEFALKISRIRYLSDDIETLAYDPVQAPCQPHRHPCAVARIHQTLRLSHGDRLIISVKHKELLYDRVEHTFLELTGESFSWS